MTRLTTAEYGRRHRARKKLAALLPVVGPGPDGLWACLACGARVPEDQIIKSLGLCKRCIAEAASRVAGRAS